MANINYDLCPTVTIADIVEQIGAAVGWLAREGPRHGAPAPLALTGHSAGGHLVAMMYVADWRARGFERAPFVGGVSLSGVHDLVPLTMSQYNVDLKLDDAEAARMSPVNLRALVDAPLVAVVGADETSEFVRQSQVLWDAWPAQRPPGASAPLIVPGRNHFSIVSDFTDASSALSCATLALLG